MRRRVNDVPRFKTREAWLTAVAERMRPWFEELGHDLPKVRMAIGFTSQGKRGKAIGQCWHGKASDDGTCEIFIVPTIDDPMRIADILAHELCHTALGPGIMHGPPFKKLANAIGLEGSFGRGCRASVATKAFTRRMRPILAKVGPLPHAKLNAKVSTTKKQSTRMIKCTCKRCGYTVRTTRKWLSEAGTPYCPTDIEQLVAEDV